jgi:hypothetical protein
LSAVDNFISVFENLGSFLFEFLKDAKSMYFATFIFLLFLLYAIILAVIGRVPGMAGDDKKANRYGKVVSFTIALLSTMSIYQLGKTQDFFGVLSRVLPIYGIFGIVVMTLLFFMVIYFGFGHKEDGRWQLALLGSGFQLAVLGYLVSMPGMQSIGWLIGIGGLILYISSTGLVQEAAKNIK